MIEKTVNKTHKDVPRNDYAYWASKTPEERLEALEFLRQQYMKATDAPQRLQRVFRVVNYKQG